MIADVPRDDPAFIGSGPTVGDASTPAEELLATLDLLQLHERFSPAVEAA